MSIGSVGSVTASPMQQSLSVHSQPSSIPINDQNIISPHQNDVSPHPHPLTPILENNNGSSNNNNNNLSCSNHDQKPEIESTTNINGQMNNKHDNNLLQKQLKQGNQDVNDDATLMTKMSNGQTSSTGASSKHGDFLSSKENNLKRPALLIRDCEKNDEEDFTTNQSLYDYSTWDAW